VSDALYDIQDPRPIVASSPYTFYLPSAARLAAISERDLVQAVIRARPRSQKYDAERMWVRIKRADTEWLEGTLESKPLDMPFLESGTQIRLRRSDVIDVIFDDSNTARKPTELPIRDYWERCLVDQAVLDRELTVGYLYREAPDMGKPDDKFPDSGWRIRGDMREADIEALGRRKFAYIALGKVLNQDDTWLHLIDEPIGARFQKNYQTGLFERLAEDDDISLGQADHEQSQKDL
jgi:hypothetical protein